MGFVLAAFLVKVVPWIVGGVAGIYATKKITQSFGSTPTNDVKQIPQLERMSPKEMYQDRKEWRQDRVKYHKKKGKKIQEEIDKLNRKIELENEERNKLLQRQRETNDPAEKSRIQQQILAIDNKISGFQKQVNSLGKNKKESEQKIDEVYNKFDDSLSQEQFVEQSNSINWKSYKNWGIIAICIVVGIMIIVFIKKILNSLISSLK